MCKRGLSGGGGGKGAAGARERRRACRGEILTRTQMNASSDIQTHLGGIDDRLIFIRKFLLMKKKFISRKRGTFLIQGKRAGA